jgi:hypothetical protein
MPFAVRTFDLATPDALVTAVLAPPGKLARGPDPGGGMTNVTVTPPTGLPLASFTVATRRFAKAVLIGVLWPDPLVAVIDAGGPGVLVRANAAGVATPVTLPFTV